ncbi:hypothetical protein TKK_0015913 [Trichogramma kaykai]
MEKKIDSFTESTEEQYDQLNFEIFDEHTVEVESIEVEDQENHTVQSENQIVEGESESEYPKLEFENSETEDSILDVENSKLEDQLLADESMELDDQIVEVENIDYSENDVFYNKSPTTTMSEVVLAYELENAQCSSAIENNSLYEPKGLTKLLSIRLDKPISHHYDIVSLRDEINKVMDKQKELSRNIELAKEIVTSFSMQAVSNLINETNINFLVSATLLLQKVLTMLGKQELQLLDLQQSIEHLPPLEVLADYACKKNDLHLNSDNEKNTDNLKRFYVKNEEKLKKRIVNLEKKQKTHDDKLKEKNKIIIRLKKKIFIMRKQLKIAAFPPDESNNLLSTQMQKVKELVNITNSLVNSVSKKSNYNPFFKQMIEKKDNKIYELNGTIENCNKVSGKLMS